MYYKTIAKKCYQRMKRQKSAYETQIDGLEGDRVRDGFAQLDQRVLRVHGGDAVARQNSDGGWKWKRKRRDVRGRSAGLGVPDVDDVNLRLGGFLK